MEQEKHTSPQVSISPNPIREKVLIGADGRMVSMNNKTLRQAQEELKTNQPENK